MKAMTEIEQERAIRTVRLGLTAHRFAVMWLAVISILVGIVMIVTGAPAFLEDWFSPWSRVVLGVLAFSPGLLTVIGVAVGPARIGGWWTQVLGLLGQAVWYASMMGAYVGLLVYEGPQWADLGEPLNAAVSGRAYVPLIYLGLLGLALIPLVTLLKIGRPGR